jgi:hypothetical protein
MAILYKFIPDDKPVCEVSSFAYGRKKARYELEYIREDLTRLGYQTRIRIWPNLNERKFIVKLCMEKISLQVKDAYGLWRDQYFVIIERQ